MIGIDREDDLAIFDSLSIRESVNTIHIKEIEALMPLGDDEQIKFEDEPDWNIFCGTPL